MRYFRWIGILCMLMLWAQKGQAQVVGKVVDSTGAPLPFANIVAISDPDSTMSGFTTSGDDGNYSLSLETGKYYIVASFVGYASVREPISITDPSQTKTLDFVLGENRVMKEIIVEGRRPVTVKEDTVTFDPAQFATGNEAVLGDLLKRLPGVEVDKGGKVRVNGEEVGELLIDGKAFFQGDASIATNNLNAEMIDQVQLIDNYTQSEQLQGMNGDGKMALNIVLKEGQRAKVFGNLHLQGGYQNRFDAKGNLFALFPKLRIGKLYQQILDEVICSSELALPQEILCLGLGNFSKTHPIYFSASMWQLGLLLQMREDWKSRGCNPRIYFFDPVSTDMERIFLKREQIQVLTEDAAGKRKISDRTLAFLPHCPAILYENLMQANPTAFRSESSCVLIGNSIRNVCDALLIPKLDLPTLRVRCNQLDERQLTVDAGHQPGDFVKAFNDTFIVRGKRDSQTKQNETQ